MPEFNEKAFRKDYAALAKKLDIDPDPNDPRHFYNYRAAWTDNNMKAVDGHLPSQYKVTGHPDRFIDGIDTMTGREANLFDNLMNTFENTRVHERFK